jgi:hypothetical protein
VTDSSRKWHEIKEKYVLKRKSIFAIAALFMLIVSTSTFMPATAANYKNIGVSTGVMVDYQYSSTASPSSHKFTVYYQSVVGTNATMVGTTYYDDGTIYGSFIKDGNISLYTNLFAQNLRPFVIAAGLNVGDNITYGAPIMMKINSSSTMLVAGSQRTVLNLNYNQLGSRTDFYYDAATGITVKANIYEGGTSWENITVISTTAWSQAPAGASDIILLAGVGAGGIVVGLIVGLAIGRMRKSK